MGEVKEKKVIVIEEMVDRGGRIRKGGEMMKEGGGGCVGGMGCECVMCGGGCEGVEKCELEEMVLSESIG